MILAKHRRLTYLLQVTGYCAVIPSLRPGIQIYNDWGFRGKDKTQQAAENSTPIDQMLSLIQFT